MSKENHQPVRMDMLHADRQSYRSPRIAELWLKGYSQTRIAKELKTSVKQVRSALNHARKLWLERKNIALTDAIAEQIRRVDLVESNAWEAWEQSKGEQVENRVTAKANTIERAKITRNSPGDPRFLDIAMKAIQQRCLLLGVFKPPEERAELAVWGVTVVVDTPEQAEGILAYEQFQKMVVEGQVVPAEKPSDDGADPEEADNADKAG